MEDGQFIQIQSKDLLRSLAERIGACTDVHPTPQALVCQAWRPIAGLEPAIRGPAVAGAAAAVSSLRMIMLPDPKHDGALTGQLDRIMQLIIPCPDRGLTDTSGAKQ